MSETGDLLRAAAGRLRGRWRKHAIGDPRGSGSVCALGACEAVGLRGTWDFNERRYFTAGVQLLAGVVWEQYPDRHRGLAIPGFNDHPDTTEAEVLAVFEKAAARADEQVTP